MTSTSTAQAKTDFHPDIEALFDLSQDGPIMADIGDAVIAVLSEALFAKAENAAKLLQIEIKSTRVERGDKPAVMLVPHEELTQLFDLLDLAIDKVA